MSAVLKAQLTGEGARELASFYAALPRVPRAAWPSLLVGMGYNFEFYDALFALVAARIQLSFADGDYTPRREAMQAALLPFCSEFGIEPSRALGRSHRDLYAEFFRIATKTAMPERYGSSADNAWLSCSRRWADRMRSRVDANDGDSLERARYALGYFWAVEHLSVIEFTCMRTAWNGLGVSASYLDVHYEVEPDHDAYATRAVLAFTPEGDPLVASAIRAHEQDLGGYYRELTDLIRADDGGERTPNEAR